MRHLLGRDPHTFNLEASRWTLATIGAACAWLHGHSPAGIWRILHRFQLTWQRARAYVHSPDPSYVAKLATIATIQPAPAQQVTLYQDEMTIERQPTLASAWGEAGADQIRARRSHRANTLTRVTGTLDPRDGRVVARRSSHVSVSELVAFYQHLVAAYPETTRIWLVQDNWPVHFHPDVLVALEPQTTVFPLPCPSSWPTAPHAWARERWGTESLPIQLVPLPTYASWCNPIEKLWRKLKQEVLHLHPFADDLPGLRAEIDRFLAQYADGSSDLLRYTGLARPN